MLLLTTFKVMIVHTLSLQVIDEQWIEMKVKTIDVRVRYLGRHIPEHSSSSSSISIIRLVLADMLLDITWS